MDSPQTPADEAATSAPPLYSKASLVLDGPIDTSSFVELGGGSVEGAEAHLAAMNWLNGAAADAVKEAMHPREAAPDDRLGFRANSTGCTPGPERAGPAR